MKWLLDVYRGEFYHFKNKQNGLPISPGILCRVEYSRSPRLLALRVKMDLREVGCDPRNWIDLAENRNQDQRREPEAESQVQSTSDDVLHAVSIPAYETHRWKEDSCSPNLDGDLAQGTDKI